MMAKTEQPPPEFTPDQIWDLSEKIYRRRLEDDCPEIRDHNGRITRKGNVQRMLEKDAEADPDDNGKKLRNRAKSYNPLTRAYLDILGVRLEELQQKGILL